VSDLILFSISELPRFCSFRFAFRKYKKIMLICSGTRGKRGNRGFFVNTFRDSAIDKKRMEPPKIGKAHGEASQGQDRDKG
jgi:hypothetical protein